MSLLRNDGWLACRECGVASAMTAPPSWLPAELDDDCADTQAQFLAQHTGHFVTLLHRCDESEILSDRPLWDPMATVSFDVTDGQQAYVLTASRGSIEEPRSYRFVPGCLAMTSAAVDIDAGDLRRGLDLEFYPDALRPTKLYRFISTLRELVSQINPDALEIAFDAADDPAISVACLPAETYEELCRRCVDIFDASELARVRRFLDDNHCEDGLLTLRVRRDVRMPTAPSALPRASRLA